MKSRARLSYIRIAPRKLRMVADAVRGKQVPLAQTQLQFLRKSGAQPILKLLNSAVDSAAKQGSTADQLFVSKIVVDEGPKLKRWLPRARGQATPMQKKVSHIIIELDERVAGQKPEPKPVKAEEKKEEKPKAETKKKVVKKEKAEAAKH